VRITAVFFSLQIARTNRDVAKEDERSEEHMRIAWLFKIHRACILNVLSNFFFNVIDIQRRIPALYRTFTLLNL